MSEKPDKAIIFTRFSRMADILERELAKYNPAKITGQTQDRHEQVKKFREDPSCRILIGTNAMREGLNLTEASMVIMYDQDYTSASMEQRIGRAWRLGQTKPVRVYHLLSEDTVDHKFKKLVAKKRTASTILLNELL